MSNHYTDEEWKAIKSLAYPNHAALEAFETMPLEMVMRHLLLARFGGEVLSAFHDDMSGSPNVRCTISADLFKLLARRFCQ